MKQESNQGRKLISHYQAEAGMLIASVANALADLGDVGKKGAIAASLGSALNNLSASVAKVFATLGKSLAPNEGEDKFLYNADKFRQEIRRKLQASLKR